MNDRQQRLAKMCVAVVHLAAIVGERSYRDALSLPCSVGLDPDSQQRVIDTVTQG